MRISEAFLVNTKNFDAIISALAALDAPTINTNLIKELGYSDSNDLLVVRLLKELKIINDDGSGAEYFDEFLTAETTKTALAKGLLEAYEHLFENHPTIHHSPPEKVKEAFEEILADKKTALIIKYISNTFICVVSFCGTSTIDKLQGNPGVKQDLDEFKAINGKEEASVNLNGNGSVNGNGTVNGNGSHKSEKTSVEEVGDKTIDELVNGFNSDAADQKKAIDSHLILKEISEKESKETATFLDSINSKNWGSSSKMTNKDSNIDDDPFGLDSPLPEETNHSPQLNGKSTNLVNGKSAKAVNENSSETVNDNSSEHVNGKSTEHVNGKLTEPVNGKLADHGFIQKALFRKSHLLYKMQRWESLLSTIEEIIKRYDNKEHEDVEETVSRSIIQRAIVLFKLGRVKEALPALDTVIDRFKDSEHPEFYQKASMAMLYKVQIIETNKDAKLLQLYDDIIERMDSNSDSMKEKMDQIHLKRFDLLIAEGDSETVLDASSKIIDRFKGNAKHTEYLQKAMIQRAQILDEMNRDEDALEAYDEFLVAFG